jgi:hypothetical protein
VLFDSDGNKLMPREQLPDLMLELGEPLGWSDEFRNNEEL